MSTNKFIGNELVRTGLRFQWAAPTPLKIAYVVVCDDASTDQWHGEAYIDGAVVMKSPSKTTHEIAGREIERLVHEKLVALFAG